MLLLLYLFVSVPMETERMGPTEMSSPSSHGTGYSESSFQMEDQGPRVLNLAERFKEEHRRLLDKIIAPVENVKQIMSVFPNQGTGFYRLQVTPLPDAKLGKGGFGFVYKAFRIGDKNKPSAERTYYAVKEMKLMREGRDEAHGPGAEDVHGTPINYLQMEYLCMKQCAGHLNVIRLFNAFAAADSYRVYFLLEYCEMGDLADLVKSQASMRLPLAAARRFFRQIAEGLNFVHARQVAHRDIKLSNVLLTRSKIDQSLMICKITDFGLSNIAWIPRQGVLFSTALKGTRQYMAPEIAAHYLVKVLNYPNVPDENNKEHQLTPIGHDVDRKYRQAHEMMQHHMQVGIVRREFTSFGKIRERSVLRYDPLPADIWALGVMLFIMVTGSCPFRLMRGRELDLMWRGKFTKYACMPAQTKEFLKSLMHPHPVRRANMRCILFHDWMKEGRRIMPPMEEPLPAPKVRERTKSDGNAETSKKRSPERRSSLPIMRVPEPVVEQDISDGVIHEARTAF